MGNIQIFCWRETEPNRRLGQMKGNLIGVGCAEATVIVVFERRQGSKVGGSKRRKHLREEPAKAEL